MATRQELERLDLSELAARCKKISDDPTIATKRAAALHEEWREHHHPTPPSPAKSQKEIEDEARKLKERMVELLSGIYTSAHT